MLQMNKLCHEMQILQHRSEQCFKVPLHALELMRSEEEIREMLREHKGKLEQVLDPNARLAGLTDVSWLQGRIQMLEWVLAGKSQPSASQQK